MTRYIWFRGQLLNGGETIYGYYVAGKNGKEYIFDGTRFPKRVTNVAQFVGVDKADNDVYEGDILIDDCGNEHVAMIQDFPKVIKSLTLKGAAT